MDPMNTTLKLPFGHLTIKSRRHLSAAERFRDSPMFRLGVFYLAWAAAPPRAVRPPRKRARKPAAPAQQAQPLETGRIEPQFTRW